MDWRRRWREALNFSAANSKFMHISRVLPWLPACGSFCWARGGNFRSLLTIERKGALSLPKFLSERNLPLPPHKFRSIAAVRFPRSFGSGRRMTSLLSLLPLLRLPLTLPLRPSAPRASTVCRPNEKVDRPRPPKAERAGGRGRRAR